MVQKTNEYVRGNEPFDAQMDRFKSLLDKIAYEVFKKTKNPDKWKSMKLDPMFNKVDMNYNTFLCNSGYSKLANYNGLKNIENKKKIKFNPYKWLRHRNLSPNNEYYIEEVYEGKPSHQSNQE